MFNLDNVPDRNEDKSWPYRYLIIGPSGSRKTHCLLNLIQKDDIIDKIYLYAKDLEEPKYQLLIKKENKKE